MQSKKLLTLLTIHIFIISVGYCQQTQFVKIYFNSDFYEVGLIQLKDSGFMFAGSYSQNISGPSIDFLMRVDKNGDTLFSRKYAPGWLAGIEMINDSTVITANGFWTLYNYGLNTIHINIITGDTSEYRQYGYYNRGWGGILKDIDNGFIMIGSDEGDYNILKLDSLENEKWHVNNNMAGGLVSLKPDFAGGYVACGRSGTLSPYNVLSLDDSGHTRWQRIYGVNSGFNDYYATSVIVMRDSNYLVGCNGADWHLMKLDRITGDTIWTRITYPPTYGGISGLIANDNNTYLGVGWNKLYLFDGNGDTLWTRNFPWDQNYFHLYSIIKTNDQGYAYCGIYDINPGPNISTYLIAFVKTDSLGNTIFTSIFNPENNLQPLSFYPNPANNEIYLNPGSMAAEKKLLFSLVDLQGRIIMQQQYDSTKPIDISAVPQGLYIATLKGKGKEVRGKVMVQR